MISCDYLFIADTEKVLGMSFFFKFENVSFTPSKFASFNEEINQEKISMQLNKI